MLKRDISYDLFARDHYTAKREPQPPPITVFTTPPRTVDGRRDAVSGSSPRGRPYPEPPTTPNGRRGAISQQPGHDIVHPRRELP